MTTLHDKPKRWRPWQFSLRTLLLLMLVVASYLGGWMSNDWQRRRELERAKQEAEAEMGTMMKYMMAPTASALPPATEPPATE